MIWIGTMNLTRTRDRGDFYCPTCTGQQTYRLRARRPFLTLYLIPTIPIGNEEIFVQCDSCRATWDVSVLDLKKEQHEMAAEEQFRDEAIRASVLVVLSDGHISESEIDALRRVTSHLLDRSVSRDEIGELCSIATQNRIEALNYVLTVSKRWNQAQRTVALQSMFLAASAEGDLNKGQLATLAKMRDVLEMTNAEYQTAIEETLRWEQVP